MAMLSSCDSCAGFLPPRADACPHCGHAASAPRKGHGAAGKLLGAASSGVIALTLMACYGGPPQGIPDCLDQDGDGFVDKHCPTKAPIDCDDHNPAIHPGAEDPEGDGVDQDCDGADGMAKVAGADGASPGSAGEAPANAEAAPGMGLTPTSGEPTSAGDAAAVRPTADAAAAKPAAD